MSENATAGAATAIRPGMQTDEWKDRVFGAKTIDNIPNSITKTGKKFGSYIFRNELVVNTGEISIVVPADERVKLASLADFSQPWAPTIDDVAMLRMVARERSEYAPKLTALADRLAVTAAPMGLNPGTTTGATTGPTGDHSG